MEQGGFLAQQRVVAAISEKIGKTVEIVHNVSSCSKCKKMKNIRKTKSYEVSHYQNKVNYNDFNTLIKRVM